ncbi:MAG: cell wall-binding repeat-containing protein, partial [Chloroflexota bacterium]
GAPVAGMQNGPVLLVMPTAIPSVVAAELVRLAPARVVILGGTGAVSDAVMAMLASMFGAL